LSIYPMFKSLLIFWNIAIGTNAFAIFFVRKVTMVETYYGCVTLFYIVMMVLDFTLLCRYENKTGENHLIELEYETWKIDEDYLRGVQREITDIIREKERPDTQ
jgi:hypothetical protein